MHQFPLLDLRDAWDDAHRALRDVVQKADVLFAASDQTWEEMRLLREQAMQAALQLGELPVAILQGVTKPYADVEVLDRRAPANVNGSSPRPPVHGDACATLPDEAPHVHTENGIPALPPLEEAEHVIITLTQALMVAADLLERRGDVPTARKTIAEAIITGRTWLGLSN
jgi:hypothetical protein